MARSKKSKVFDLFKSDFKISFFYKPSFENGDDFYYIVLDDIIELRLKVIRGVIVIDMVVPTTKSYVTPIYDKLIKTIMNQSKVTVLVSTIGDTYGIHQACILNNAPIIEDEDFITVSKPMYQKWKNQNPNDLSKFGFYILAVSSEEPLDKKDTIETKVVDVPVAKKQVKQSVSKSDTKMDKIKNFLMSSIDNLTIEDINQNNIKCSITEVDTFDIELDGESLYVKEILTNPESTLNLVKIMNILNTFEKLISIVPNIYLFNIRHMEVYRMCLAKKYLLISEETSFPENKLFKQVFLGYGTYKVIVTN